MSQGVVHELSIRCVALLYRWNFIQQLNHREPRRRHRVTQRKNFCGFSVKKLCVTRRLKKFECTSPSFREDLGGFMKLKLTGKELRAIGFAEGPVISVAMNVM